MEAATESNPSRLKRPTRGRCICTLRPSWFRQRDCKALEIAARAEEKRRARQASNRHQAAPQTWQGPSTPRCPRVPICSSISDRDATHARITERHVDAPGSQGGSSTTLACLPASLLATSCARLRARTPRCFETSMGGPAIRRQRLGSSQRNTPGPNRRFETTDIHRMRLSARPSPNVSPDRPDCPNTWLCGKGLSVRDRFDGFTDLELSANSRGYFDQTVAPSLSASSGHTTISSEPHFSFILYFQARRDNFSSIKAQKWLHRVDEGVLGD
ncbi:hypothetical protein ACCO45_001002 [Purpureocillium lilacinum]|uniref:Uncharacterized protein n=1 Tax=Purpureocillium lilacinum TaxID=33203 RepID=A0ACC4E906_PURLI